MVRGRYGEFKVIVDGETVVDGGPRVVLGLMPSGDKIIEAIKNGAKLQNSLLEGDRIADRLKLIIGLGNPGDEYAKSLHNVGFMCVSYFARQNGIRFDKKQANARTGMGRVGGVDVLLARPQTYMNRSGESVRRLLQKFHVRLDDMLVIYDDLDLPLGKMRLRPEGSSGGHNGMKSIIAELGSKGFPRLRVGIGRPEVEEQAAGKRAEVIGFLLSESSPEVKKAIDEVLPRVSDAITCWVAEGVTAAMNKYN
jgi:peptidyl-tRNA hydrolase, PTH1 family